MITTTTVAMISLVSAFGWSVAIGMFGAMLVGFAFVRRFL